MASPAQSVPDTSLGLTRDEVILLRQHQQVALAQAGGSSRAASAASSQGRLLLDPDSLQALGYHFDRLMQAIQQRLQMVRGGMWAIEVLAALGGMRSEKSMQKNMPADEVHMNVIVESADPDLHPGPVLLRHERNAGR